MAGPTSGSGETIGRPSSSTGSSSRSMTDRAQDAAGRVVDKVQETASRVVGKVQETASPAFEQVDETREEVMDQATEQVSSRLDMGKDYAAETISGLAQALRQTGQHLRSEGAQPTIAQYVDTGAERLERFSGHLRQRSTDELIAQVEWFARRNPATFAGGAFALGLLAARFLRSTATAGATGQSTSRPSTMAVPTSGATSPGYRPTPPSTAGASSRPSYPSSAPAARNIPASPDWKPPVPSGSSPTTGTGTRDTEADQLTPVPGSLSAPGGSSPTRGSTASTPKPRGTTGGDSSSSERSDSDSQRRV